MITLFVGNINFKTTEMELRAHMETVVPIRAIRMLYHKKDKLFKGVAYVDVATQGEAKQLIDQLNAKLFANRSLRISLAVERKYGE